MGALEVTDEGFEVFGHELGAVVGDDARMSTRIILVRALQDDFGIRFFDGRADIPG